MAQTIVTEGFIVAKCEQHAAERATGVGKTRIYYDHHPNAPPGFGVRITAKGTASFVLNYYARGSERRATIGAWGNTPRWSVAAARIEANRLRARILAGEDPVADERQAKAAAEAARANHTLTALVAAYVADLRARGKPSAREVENLFGRTVEAPFPGIAALPIGAVTVEAVLPALRKLTWDHKYRDAEKLATYLRAAFNTARDAHTGARGDPRTAFFNIRRNPLDGLRIARPKMTEDVARKVRREYRRTLTQPQLAAYWKRIAAQADAYGAMLRLHLLTGGQRREQLARIVRNDYNADAHTLTLWDGKGRRSQAREHVIPLLEEAEAALLAMAGNKGPHLFTVSEGAQAATAAMLDHALTRVSAAMIDAGEVDRTITSGVIRRTVDALLGDHDISLEVRGKLQSYGVGSAASRHDESGAYLQHKRKALETLRQLCESTPADVAPATRKRKTSKTTSPNDNHPQRNTTT